jgi:hypothetical protein
MAFLRKISATVDERSCLTIVNSLNFSCQLNLLNTQINASEVVKELLRIQEPKHTFISLFNTAKSRIVKIQERFRNNRQQLAHRQKAFLNIIWP